MFVKFASKRNLSIESTCLVLSLLSDFYMQIITIKIKFILSEHITAYCHQMTSYSRNFMDQNPEKVSL